MKVELNPNKAKEYLEKEIWIIKDKKPTPIGKVDCITFQHQIQIRENEISDFHSNIFLHNEKWKICYSQSDFNNNRCFFSRQAAHAYLRKQQKEKS